MWTWAALRDVLSHVSYPFWHQGQGKNDRRDREKNSEVERLTSQQTRGRKKLKMNLKKKKREVIKAANRQENMLSFPENWELVAERKASSGWRFIYSQTDQQIYKNSFHWALSILSQNVFISAEWLSCTCAIVRLTPGHNDVRVSHWPTQCCLAPGHRVPCVSLRNPSWLCFRWREWPSVSTGDLNG